MFCIQCGNEVTSGNFCSKCGTKADGGSSQQQQSQPYQGGAYNFYQKEPVPHYAPGSFIEKLHGFGISILFLVGIIMFSAGSLFSTFASFSATSIFSLMIMALPITGFWLIFAASKMPKMPEKTLPALTLFKVSIIIELVGSCFLALALLIGSIALFVVGANLSDWGGGEAFYAGGSAMLLVTGGVVAFIVIYYKAILSVISGIRDGIMRNLFNPLPGIKTFTILAYIGIGVSVLFTSLSSFLLPQYMNMIIYAIPSDYQDIVESMLPSSGSGFTLFFTLVMNAGIVVCIVVLNQFNNSLLYNRSQNTNTPM